MVGLRGSKVVIIMQSPMDGNHDHQASIIKTLDEMMIMLYPKLGELTMNTMGAP